MVPVRTSRYSTNQTLQQVNSENKSTNCEKILRNLVRKKEMLPVKKSTKNMLFPNAQAKKQPHVGE